MMYASRTVNKSNILPPQLTSSSSILFHHGITFSLSRSTSMLLPSADHTTNNKCGCSRCYHHHSNSITTTARHHHPSLLRRKTSSPSFTTTTALPSSQSHPNLSSSSCSSSSPKPSATPTCSQNPALSPFIMQAYKEAVEDGSLTALAGLVELTTKSPINPLSINDIINQTAQPAPKSLGRNQRRRKRSNGTAADKLSVGGLSQLSSSPSRLFTYSQTILPSALLSSANWVQRELPTRLAHRLHDFHRLPHIIVANPFVSDVHRLYCKAYAELFAYGPLASMEQEEGFTKVLKLAVAEHSQVVSLMQKGVSELKVSHPDIVLDHFLDRLFVTRIGNRVLAEHHLALHEDYQHGEWNSDYIGIVNQRTRPAEMIRLIADRVSQVALHTYSCCPQVVVVGDLDIAFPYIPEHLRFVIFEMLKNAIRATVEKHKDRSDHLPSVTVAVHKGQTELFIKIQDKGGGIPAGITTTTATTTQRSKGELGIDYRMCGSTVLLQCVLWMAYVRNWRWLGMDLACPCRGSTLAILAAISTSSRCLDMGWTHTFDCRVWARSARARGC
eukprot:GHVS01058969.1.p1 GENE.GHVS01058969.1~~GHVS01058969.1.p1  ORF type:complete len:557 (-),score=69.81 GHVS01058969.1:862-2532(-)